MSWTNFRNAGLSALAMLFIVPAGAMAQDDQRESRREEFKAALETCLTENGLTPPPEGEKPSKEHRKLIKTCLKAKGFEHPHRFFRGHHKCKDEDKGTPQTQTPDAEEEQSAT